MNKGINIWKQGCCYLIACILTLATGLEASNTTRSVSKSVSLFDTYSRMVSRSLDQLNPELAKIQLKRLDTYYKRIRSDIQKEGLSASEQAALKKRIQTFQQIKSSVHRALPEGSKVFQDVQFFLENDKSISQTRYDSTLEFAGLPTVQSEFSSNILQSSASGSQIRIENQLQSLDGPGYLSVAYVGASDLSDFGTLFSVETGWSSAIEFLEIPNVLFAPSVYVQQSDSTGLNQAALTFQLSKSISDFDYSGGYQVVASDLDASLYHRFFADLSPASAFNASETDGEFEAQAESIILPETPEASQINVSSRYGASILDGALDSHLFTAFYPGEFEESHLGIFSEFKSEDLSYGISSKWTLDIHGYVMTDQKLAKLAYSETRPFIFGGYDGSLQNLSMSLGLDAREGYSHGLISWGFTSPFATVNAGFEQLSGSIDRYQSLADNGSYSMMTVKKDIQSFTDTTQQQYRVSYKHYDTSSETFANRLTVATAFVSEFAVLDKILVGSIDLSHDISLDASRDSETMIAFKCDVLFGSL